MDALIVGIILIVLLAGGTLLQWLLRRRQAAKERALPHVAELAAIALPAPEFPAGYHVHYRGPLTNERIASRSDDENATLDALDEQGRLIGYRQAFRDPRSYGELIDVLLNNTLHAKTPHRMISVDLALFEDAEGAREAIDRTPPPPSDGESPITIRVVNLGADGMAFACDVWQWSRLQGARELQRKVEVRWRHGRLGCVVAGDSEPPGGVGEDDVRRLARRVQERLAASALAHEL